MLIAHKFSSRGSCQLNIIDFGIKLHKLCTVLKNNAEIQLLKLYISREDCVGHGFVMHNF